jgi:hypothetical protein
VQELYIVVFLGLRKLFPLAVFELGEPVLDYADLCVRGLCAHLLWQDKPPPSAETSYVGRSLFLLRP